MNRTMSWEGRQLKTVNSGSNNISYTYNSDGLRRTKTVNGQTSVYEYSGTQLIHEQQPTYDLYYSYDVNGGLLARYVYDAWGKVATILDANNNQITDTNHIGHINPFRYRGYYHDTETNFYYLQSRYYDPEVGRFINADGQISDIGGDVLGYNLYTYCMNNPVNMSDESGTWPSLVKVLIGVAAIVIGAAIIATTVATCCAVAVFTSAVGYGLVSSSAAGVVSATTSAISTAVSSEISGEDEKTTLNNIISSSIEGFANGFMWGGIVFGGSYVAGDIVTKTHIFKREVVYGNNNFLFGSNELTIWRHGKNFRIDTSISNGLHYHWRFGIGGIARHRYGGINEMIGIVSGILSSFKK